MIVRERSDLFAVSPLRFLIMALCIFVSLRAESRSIGVMNVPADTSKNKYDINDPRNPNCPCHKYQNIANQEYSNLQMQQGNYLVNNNRNNNESDEEVAEYDNSSYSYHHVFSRRHHDLLKESKRYLNKKFYKMKGKWRKKYFKRNRSSVLIVACFNWN
jgi:hypothetical protein